MQVQSVKFFINNACMNLSHPSPTFSSDQWQMPVQTPLGQMTLVASQHGLCGAWFEHQKHVPDLHHLPWGPSQSWLLQAKAQLSEYFEGKRKLFELPLIPLGGTGFQHQVWQALAMIPFGKFSSYAEIARFIGKPQSARAVGMAVGRNPLSIFLPCHRVMASNGALTGYAGGLDRKISLLKIEGTLL
jgi:methylated-DNA-[protein]-cysteine S-methyltransferase